MDQSVPNHYYFRIAQQDIEAITARVPAEPTFDDFVTAWQAAGGSAVHLASSGGYDRHKVTTTYKPCII